MSFIVSGYNCAELKPITVNGVALVGRRARLSFVVHAEIYSTPPKSQILPAAGQSVEPGEPVNLHSFGGSVIVAAFGTTTTLGYVVPERPFWITTNSRQYPWTGALCIDLGREQIEALEDIRQGGDITFEVTVTALGERLVRPVGPDGKVASSGTRREVGDLCETLRFPINQSAWLKILTDIRYGRFIVLEIPVTDTTIGDETRKCLVQAQTYLAQGHYRESVATMRRALEQIEEKTDLAGATKQFNNDRRVMTKAQRFQFVAVALKHLAGMTHHDDGPEAGSRDYSRQEAVAAMGMTVALMTVLSQKDDS